MNDAPAPTEQRLLASAYAPYRDPRDHILR